MAYFGRLSVTFQHCKVGLFEVHPSKLPKTAVLSVLCFTRKAHTMVFTTYKTTFLPYFSPQEIASTAFHSRTSTISTNNSEIFQMCTAKAPQDRPRRAQRYDRNDDLSNGPSKSLAWVHQTSAILWCTRGNTWHGLWTFSAGHASMDSSKVALLIIGSQDSPRIEIPRCRGSSDLLAWQPAWEQ